MNDDTQSWGQPGNSQIDYEIVLDDMLKCFLRYWWQILVLLSVVCSIVYGAAKAAYKPVYISTSTFVVSSLNSAGHDRNQYNSAVTSQLGNVFPYLLSSDILTKLVAEDMGTNSVPGRVTSEALKGTSLITLKAEASEAKLSHDILQSVIKNYPEVSSYVIGDIELKLMDESGIPTKPSNPLRARYYAGLAGLAAAALVVLLLFLYAITRMTVRSKKDLKVLFNVPALGSVPSVPFLRFDQYYSSVQIPDRHEEQFTCFCFVFRHSLLHPTELQVVMIMHHDHAALCQFRVEIPKPRQCRFI
jgi:receptor protein-tyrosine kinase